jgi:hypothetical protein
MEKNTYNNLIDYLDKINTSTFYLSEFDIDEMESLGRSELEEINHLIDCLELGNIEHLKCDVEELLKNIDDLNFQHEGSKEIKVCLQYQYISEDDDTVTYEYTVDGGGVVNTIDISKEYLIDELTKEEDINKIILSKIESNYF